MVRYSFSAGEDAVELLFLCEPPRTGQLLVQWCSGGENFAALAAAMCNSCPPGLGPVAGAEAMLVLALTVTYSNSYFHIPLAVFLAVKFRFALR